MKNIIHKSIILLATISLCSCSDFLKESSQDEVIPSTIEDLDQLLAYEGYPRRDLSLMPYLDLLDDDVTQYITSSNANPIVTKYSPLYLWGGRSAESNEKMFEDFNNLPNPTSGITSIEVDSYATFYKMIAGCNVVIDMINEVDGEENMKKRVEGEALVLRSFYYFNLINLYAYPYNTPNAPQGQSAGIPLKLSSAINQNSVSRSTVAEVYNSIINDIEKGINLLTEVSSVGTKFRVGTRTAHLLASRYYLFMENWEKAAEHANAIFSIPGGNLYLFAITTVTYPANTDGLDFPHPFTLDNPEILFFYAEDSEHCMVQSIYSSDCFMASDELLNSYANDDQRLKSYLSPRNGREKSSKFATDLEFGACLRLSEAYLNRAEAYAHMAKKGQSEYLDKAISDLNTLREKRIKNYSSQTWTSSTFNHNADKLIEECKAERRRELCFEGNRWFDLRRYGMQSFSHDIDESPNTGDAYTVEIGTATPKWVLPIMQVHKESNPALN